MELRVRYSENERRKVRQKKAIRARHSAGEYLIEIETQ